MTKLEIAAFSFFIALVAIFGLYSAMAALPPASYWFEVDHLEVQSSNVGDAIVVDYDRQIKHEFEAAWRVEVWQLDAYSGKWISYCTTPETVQGYKPSATPPNPVTLEWFAYTNKRCYDLPQGTYYINADWTLNPDSAFSRRVVATSQPFTIRGE